jgi:hypothetical protein
MALFLSSFRGARQREPGISIDLYHFEIPGLRLSAHPGMTTGNISP